MKNMLIKGIAVLALTGWAGIANAIPIVEFTSVNGASVAADVEGPGVSGFDLGRSVGVIQAAGGSFSSRHWTQEPNKLGALIANDTIFWGFNSTQGYDLTSLSFGYNRSAEGPTAISVDIFIDNVFQGPIYSDDSVRTDSTAIATIDLSAFDNITNAFFRLSGWNAATANGWFDIENRAALGNKGIVISGDVVSTSVPAPASLALLGLGLAGIGWSRRRKI